MKILIVLSCAAVCVLAKPGYLADPGLAYSYLAAPYAVPAAPAVAAVHPVVTSTALTAVPVGIRTQYHAQNEFGQASYGHAEPFQTHNAVQDAAGNKIGSYSYVAPDGQIVKAHYIADGAGFRVATNALPVGPSGPVGPLPVAPADTPEVVAAREAHLAEVEAAKSRSKRGILDSHYYTSPGLLYHSRIAAVAHPVVAHSAVVHPAVAHSAVVHPAVAHSAVVHPAVAHSAVVHPAVAHSAVVHPAVAHSAVVHPAVAHSAVVHPAVSAPIVREAVLTKVVNNPGHAISYRVD